MNYYLPTNMQSVCSKFNGSAKFIALFLLLAGFATKSNAQIPITYYDFELNTARGSTSEFTPELSINSAGTFTQVGGTTSASPGGAGANLYGGSAGTSIGFSNVQNVVADPTTAATTYFTTTINTTNFSGITISYDYRISASGPGNTGIIVTDGTSTVTGTFIDTAASTVFHTLTWNLTPNTFVNNKAALTVKVYFYKGVNASFGSGGTARIDNFTVRATSQISGTANLLSEDALYTGFTSGLTGSVFIEGGFTVTGSGTVCRMNNSGINIGTGNTFLVTGSGTLDCGQTASAVMNGAGTFQIDAGASMIVRSPNGLNATSTSGNIQTTTRNYAAGANYTFSHFSGSAMNSGGGIPATISGSITFNNSGGIVLGQNQKVTGTLTMTNTVVVLGNKNLTLGATAVFSGTFGAGNMIVPAGAGEFRKEYTAAGSFLFPVGDTTGTLEYSPATINFTSGTFTGTAYASVRVINAKHPNNLSSTNYLNRYWSLSTNNISAFSCNLTFAYTDADIVGTETSMAGARYLTVWNKAGTVNAASNTFTRTTTLSLADYTTINGILPTSTISGNTSPVCEGNSLTITAVPSGDAPFTYLWNTGETTQSISTDPNNTTTYSVTVSDGNGIAAAAPSSTTVTVNPAATVDAGIDQTICSNATATMAGSVGGGASSGTWTTFGDGTFNNASLLNAVYTPGPNDKITGYATLLLTTNDPAGPCGSVNDAMVVFFDYPPVVSACPSNITQCNNHIATFSTPTATGTPAASVSCSPASGSTFATGTTLVTCTATNYCGSDACSFNVTINETPVIGACPGDITQCDNHVVTFSTPTASGTPTASVSCSPASGSTFATGTTLVTCTATNSCGSDACSFNVTIHETPVIGACPGDITQCDNHVVTFSTPTASGTPSPSVSCSPASGSTFATGTTLVTCTATNSCGSDACSFNVTIHETPVIGACPGDITQCDNHVVTFSTPTASGTPAASVSCSPASGSTFATGTTLVTCTATNSCGSDACSFNVTINETPVIGACPGDITQCDNHVVTFSTPTASGTPAASVSCSPASGSTFATGTTLVTCTATNSCGSDACSFNVTISVSPTVNAGADQTICYTGTATMNGSFGGGATSATWSTLGDGTFDNVNLMNAVYSPGPTDIINGTVTLVLTTDDPAGPCTLASDQMVLTVRTSVPAQPGIVTGTTPACPGNTLNYSISAVATATSYTWASLDGTASITSGQGTVNVSILFGTLPGTQSTYPMSVIATNACGNSTAKTFSPRSKISQPTFTSGLPVVVCQNTNGVVYSVNPVAGAASYTWTITGTGASIVGSNTGTSITVNFGTFTSVTINVTATNACMTTGARVMTVNSVPAIPGTVVGASYVCPNGTYQYSVNPVPGALSYVWTGPAGSSVSGSSNIVNITFGASIPGGSSVSVRAVGSCANSSALRSKGVASGMPNVPSAISGLAAGQCGETGVSYSIIPNYTPPVNSYNWTVNNGATISGPSNLSSVSVNFPTTFTTVTISVTATNGCGTGLARTLTVNGAPGVPAVITGNASPCAGAIETYGTSAAGATSYNWTTPAGSTILGPANGSSILLQWGSTGGNITAQAVNACGGSGLRTFTSAISCRESQVSNSLLGLNAEVYPNPVTEKASLKFNTSHASQFNLDLTNVLGQKMFSQVILATEGTNIIDLDLSQVAKGVYLLNITGGDLKDQIRVVVQ